MVRQLHLKALSKSEREVFEAIRYGLNSSQIAERRKCSVRTIEKHRSNIIKKLGIKGMTLQQFILQNH